MRGRREPAARLLRNRGMLTHPNDWPADPILGGVIAALTPSRMLPILREHARASDGAWEDRRGTECRAIEALYDPCEHVRIAFALLPSPDTELHRAWADGEVFYVRYPARPSVSRRSTVVNIDGFDVELYRFPNDRRLRGLRKFASRDRAALVWQRWLDEDEPGLDLDRDSLRRSLLRYVPEQKWIIQLQGQCYDTVGDAETKRSIAVRSADADSCKVIYDRVVALRRARHQFKGSFRVPKPVALDSTLGLLAVRWIWGDTLLDLLRREEPAEIMTRVAQGLHAFHCTTIESLKPRTIRDDLESATLSARELAVAIPEAHELLGSTIEALSLLQPGTTDDQPMTVHNDFHWNQLRGRADRLTILDLERCVRGDPYADVATFVTQLSCLPLRLDLGVNEEQASRWARSFLDAWESRTGADVDSDRFRRHSTVALMTLARGMMRHLRPGWRSLALRFLERAAECVTTRQGAELVV